MYQLTSTLAYNWLAKQTDPHVEQQYVNRLNCEMLTLVYCYHQLSKHIHCYIIQGDFLTENEACSNNNLPKKKSIGNLLFRWLGWKQCLSTISICVYIIYSDVSLSLSLLNSSVKITLWTCTIMSPVGAVDIVLIMWTWWWAPSAICYDRAFS